MSQPPHPQPEDRPAVTTSAAAEEAPAADETDAEQTEADESAETPGLTRRERREAARGGPTAKVSGPVGGRPQPPPARHRDYASRKRG